MTTPVSQTNSADNTKNTKDNRKIVVARYGGCHSIFKIPDNLDLEDTTIVTAWVVKWNELRITYTTKENYILYVGKEPTKGMFIFNHDKDDLTQEIEVYFVSKKNLDDYDYPDDVEIADAKDWIDLNTKNTKNNRKVLVAEHTMCLVYKIPDNLDLEDKTIVKEYWVRNATMYIQYTSEEHFRQYYKDDDKTDFRIDKDNYFVQNIQCDYGDDINMLTNPTATKIEDADE